MVHRLRLAGLAAGAFAASFATTAVAAPAPHTRLVSCGAETCLLVTGRRDSVETPVSINGHPVAVEGRRKWRVRLPLATVRQWSAPFARSMEVTVARPDGSPEIAVEASLPIGLLGHVTNLAALVVRVR